MSETRVDRRILEAWRERARRFAEAEKVESQTHEEAVLLRFDGRIAFSIALREVYGAAIHRVEWLPGGSVKLPDGEVLEPVEVKDGE